MRPRPACDNRPRCALSPDVCLLTSPARWERTENRNGARALAPPQDMIKLHVDWAAHTRMGTRTHAMHTVGSVCHSVRTKVMIK